MQPAQLAVAVATAAQILRQAANLPAVRGATIVMEPVRVTFVGGFGAFIHLV